MIVSRLFHVRDSFDTQERKRKQLKARKKDTQVLEFLVNIWVHFLQDQCMEFTITRVTEAFSLSTLMASHTLLCIQEENEKDEVVTLLDELRSSTMQPSLYKVSVDFRDFI